MSLWAEVRFGANYVPSRGWYDGFWNGDGFEALRGDLSALADLGCDHIRVQLVWPWFHPEPGRISPTHARRLVRLLDEAEALGLGVWPCLFTGWLSGFAFEPPFVRRETFFSALARPFQEEYLDAVARLVRGHAALEGIDLGNEMNVVWSAEPSAGDAWLAWAVGELRGRLPGVPVVCGIDHNPLFRPEAFSARGIAESTGVGIVHAYSFWSGAQQRYPRDHPLVRRLGAYLARLFRSLAGEPRLPVWLQEFGQSASCWDADDIPNLMEETVRAGVAEGVARFTWWASHDAPEGRGFHPFELDLGLLDLSNRPKASGLRFRSLVGELAGRPVGVPDAAPEPPQTRPEAVWEWLERQASDDPIPIH
ncbi:MAG: hypothetical protein N2109_12460 [Fimbriimonadales bacterium]|nr:hypothetical protein [Fimbriimonadales bacterium]